MDFYTSLKQRLESASDRQLYSYYGIFFTILALVFGITLYVYHQRQTDLEQKMRALNKKRNEIQAIITKNAAVKEQQQEVEALLAQDKNFLIARYLSDTVTELGLDRFLTKKPEVTEEALNSDYTQLKLSVTMSKINMKQLTDLLYAIEQNPRVFVTELDVLKTPNEPTIDINVVISTLQPKSSGLE